MKREKFEKLSDPAVSATIIPAKRSLGDGMGVQPHLWGSGFCGFQLESTS